MDAAVTSSPDAATELRAKALLGSGRLQTAAGRHQAAAAVFRRAVAHEPLNETAHRELMSSWARLGETARAVRHYQELTELLRDQVGAPPPTKPRRSTGGCWPGRERRLSRLAVPPVFPR